MFFGSWPSTFSRLRICLMVKSLYLGVWVLCFGNLEIMFLNSLECLWVTWEILIFPTISIKSSIVDLSSLVDLGLKPDNVLSLINSSFTSDIFGELSFECFGKSSNRSWVTSSLLIDSTLILNLWYISFLNSSTDLLESSNSSFFQLLEQSILEI